MNPQRAIAYSRQHRARFVAELMRLVRFPTVSNQKQHKPDLESCAKWLAGQLRGIGFPEVRVVPTSHHPVVYASRKAARNAPTVLLYGHYDVQPAEPVDEWKIPPFQPVVRGNRLYGRGASDDKGQLFTHLKALESILKTEGHLPVNIKCLFEGDEEQGSPALESFVTRNKRALAADAALISDTRMLGPNQPTIGYSQRGNVRFELEVRGTGRELHSGNFGGAILNPLQSLCEILAGFHDGDGRIAICGFYGEVREWPEDERDYMAQAGPSDERILSDAGAGEPWGEPGFSAYERVTIRPSLTVNGVSGGYAGPGIKTVLPARALAKFSVRTVPDQTASLIEKNIRDHLQRAAPSGLHWELRLLGATDPVVVDRNHPFLRAASLACMKGFGVKPRFIRSGGSIGGASVVQKVLGIPPVILGFALPQDNVHAPNESFLLSNFFRGIETSIWFFTAAARLPGARRPAAREMACDR